MNVAVRKTPTQSLPAGLPAALKPWSDIFQHMSEDSLRIVGGLMGQLDAVLQATFEMELQSQGEFHGYDGMEVKGHIDRLMPSEWLWKELEPEEFLRRFAEQELLFHKPSHENPTDERTHLVMVDCGPAMLGRPRIVALAALLSVFAKARQRDARVLWIAPHGGVMEWQPLLSLSDLDIFLQTANPMSLSIENIESAIEKLPGDVSSDDLVLWTVGGRALPVDSFDFKVNQVVVSETLRAVPDEEPVAEGKVLLKTSSGRERIADLTFPDEAACVVLLREPFRTQFKNNSTGRKEKEDSNANWAPQSVVIDRRSSRVLMRTPTGILVLKFDAESQKLSRYAHMEIKSFEHLLGVNYKGPDIYFVVTRRYNTYGQVILRRYSANTLADEVVMNVDDDHPVLFHDHGKHALPPLIKPGRRRRFVALSSTGERFILQDNQVQIPAQLKQLAIHAYFSENHTVENHTVVSIRETKKGVRFLSMRELNTEFHYSYPVADGIEIQSRDDFLFWGGATVRHAPEFVVARNRSGQWFGAPGNQNLEEIALPEGSKPLGKTLNTDPARDSSFFANFWDQNKKELIHCNIERDNTVHEVSRTALQTDYDGVVYLSRTGIFCWKLDGEGYPQTIEQLMPSYSDERDTFSVHKFVSESQ